MTADDVLRVSDKFSSLPGALDIARFHLATRGPMDDPFLRPTAYSDWTWKVQSDLQWDHNEVATFVGSQASGAYFLRPAHRRLCVTATPPPSQRSGEADARSDVTRF